MSPVVKMQQSEVTLGHVGVVLGWATVYYSEGLLCHGLGQVQPSSGKFTSETHSPSKDTEVWIGDDRHRKKKSKKEDKEKEKDKQDRLGGWAAGRRLPMTAWILLGRLATKELGPSHSSANRCSFVQVWCLWFGLQIWHENDQNDQFLQFHYRFSFFMLHAMTWCIILQKFAMTMPWSWSVLADRMWEDFVCCRWLKMQRVVLSKYRFQENTHMQLDRIPNHSTGTESTI